MKCDKVQEQISDYFEEMLTPQQKQAVQDHLDQCDACRSEYDAYMVFFQEFESPDIPQVPSGFLDRLHARINKEFQEETDPAHTIMLGAIWTAIPAFWRTALVAASVVTAVFYLFFTNLLPVSFSNKVLVQTEFKEPKFFDDPDLQNPEDNTLMAQNDTGNQQKNHYKEKEKALKSVAEPSEADRVAKSAVQSAPETSIAMENMGQGVEDVSDSPQVPFIPQSQSPVRQIASEALILKSLELAVFIDYDTFKPEVASIDSRTKLPDPGLSDEVQGYNALGYFSEMLLLINKLADDSQGAVVDRKAGPPPYIVVRIPVEKLTIFLAKLDQYGENKIVLPPGLKHVDATQLDKDSDNFVQIELKISMP